jgi:hypothetical protein
VRFDGFAFWLGHQYHRQIRKGWPLNRFPWLIERSAQLIRKYGIASVFLARFTAVVRAFVPLLAGRTENVISPLLCGEYPIGTPVGTDAHFPRSVGRPGTRT